MTPTKQNSNGMPWSSRRSGPSPKQIRQVANSVEENGRSTWHDSAVSYFLLFIIDILSLTLILKCYHPMYSMTGWIGHGLYK